MSIDLQTAPDASVTTLVSGIITDAQDLVKQEFQLLKHEVRADLLKSVQALAAFWAAACLGFAGMLMLAFTLVYLLQWSVPTLPLWACYGILGLVLGSASAGLAFAGKARIASLWTTPNEAVQSLKENLQWKTNPK